MLKEILTCDGCGAEVQNKPFFEITARKSLAPAVRRRIATRASYPHVRRVARAAYAELCGKCMAKVKEVIPALAPVTEKRGRRSGKGRPVR